MADQSTKLAAEGKFAEAIAEQKKAIEIDPNRETLHYGLAQRYAQAGDLTKAIQALEIAIKIHPVSMKREAAADPIFAKLKDNTKFKRLVSQSRAASD